MQQQQLCACQTNPRLRTMGSRSAALQLCGSSANAAASGSAAWHGANVFAGIAPQPLVAAGGAPPAWRLAASAWCSAAASAPLWVQ